MSCFRDFLVFPRSGLFDAVLIESYQHIECRPLRTHSRTNGQATDEVSDALVHFLQSAPRTQAHQRILSRTAAVVTIDCFARAHVKTAETPIGEKTSRLDTERTACSEAHLSEICARGSFVSHRSLTPSAVTRNTYALVPCACCRTAKRGTTYSAFFLRPLKTTAHMGLRKSLETSLPTEPNPFRTTLVLQFQPYA